MSDTDTSTGLPIRSGAATSGSGEAARSARRRRQLIDAALDGIAEQGLRDTTVQDLARRAGMAVGSISQYFASKDQLLTATLQLLSDEFEAGWRAAIERAGAEPAARLSAFVMTYFEPALCQRKKIAVWFAFWGEVKARPHYRRVCAGHDREHDRVLQELCAAVLATRTDPAPDPARMTKIITALCQGLWLDMLTAGETMSRRDYAGLALAGLESLLSRPPA